MYRSLIFGTIAGALGLAGLGPVTAQSLCRPKLTVTAVRFSAMIPPTLKRKWAATVIVDASRCQADSSGHFEIVFTRLSELGPDLDFRERYTWRSPSVEVTEDFARDEAVQRFRVENITSCVCLK